MIHAAASPPHTRDTIANIMKPKRAPLTAWIVFTATTLVALGLCAKAGTLLSIGGWHLELPRLFWSDNPASASIPAGGFILLYAAIWAICMGLLLTFPRGLNPKKALILLFASAILCRALLLPHPPSDDINRYLWEGRLIREGISPYSQAPDDPSLATLAQTDPYHAGINHPDIPAAYPPLALYLFALGGAVSYGTTALKIMIVIFDLGTLAFLLAILAHRGLSLRWSILYAFNPVILFGFAGQAHFDAIQSFFLLGSIYFYDHKKWLWMFLLAGLAVQSKYVAVLALPFLIRKDNWRYLPAAILAMLLPLFPFIIDDGWQILAGLKTYGEQYAFNSSIHALLRYFLGGIAPATFWCKVLLLGMTGVGIIYFHPELNPKYKDDPIQGSFFAFGTLLLLSPTVHFWYLAWIIPFLAIRPSISWMVLCLTVSGYFIAVGINHTTGRWDSPVWVYYLEWIPFYLLFGHEVLLFVKRLNMPMGGFSAPRSVSVVIPTQNESDTITQCIQTLKQDPAVSEIIVVDGGSKDNTADRASALGARVIPHPLSPDNGGGRGGQIQRGIRAAKGDVVALVHADTRVPAPIFSRMCRILERQPSLIGGAVGNLFDAKGFSWRLLEWANDFRMVFLGISFGDQVQFFRRQPVIDAGIFPALPLMEDVELSLRLHHLGRQTFLFGSALTSPRTWRTQGFGRVFLVLKLMTTYLWQRLWRTPDTLSMYYRYYGKRIKS
jgi:Glycosyl transferase family 2